MMIFSIKNDDFMLTKCWFCNKKVTLSDLSVSFKCGGVREELLRPLTATVINYDEFCIKNDEFCIKNDEFCIKKDELCIKMMNLH